jgi:hypothetical protein
LNLASRPLKFPPFFRMLMNGFVDDIMTSLGVTQPPKVTGRLAMWVITEMTRSQPHLESRLSAAHPAKLEREAKASMFKLSSSSLADHLRARASLRKAEELGSTEALT